MNTNKIMISECSGCLVNVTLDPSYSRILFTLSPEIRIMAFEENTILFGHDPEPGIVAAEFDGVDKITLYLRQRDGTTARHEILSPVSLGGGGGRRTCGVRGTGRRSDLSPPALV